MLVMAKAYDTIKECPDAPYGVVITRTNQNLMHGHRTANIEYIVNGITGYSQLFTIDIPIKAVLT
jgi:hypothetical protein